MPCPAPGPPRSAPAAPLDATALRREFPVLERVAYLNAGTDGPVPQASVQAAAEQLEREAREGRIGAAHFERRKALMGDLRAEYAEVLGADPADVAITTSTTEGMGRVIAGLDLRPGDEVVTSDTEHPGLLGPLAALRRQGIRVTVVPLKRVAEAVGPDTRLVACSHVSWVSGELAPRELAEVDVPVLLDGAQGAGAVPVDVTGLGCDAYAAAGQKWLCGPDGTGMLWVAPELRGRLAIRTPGYANLENAADGLDAAPWPDARGFDTPSLGAVTVAGALAAARVLRAPGWDAVHERAAALARTFADALRERGREVHPRDDTTLVSWRSDDAEAEVAALAEAGVALRFLPGRGLVRASVGAWNDESDLDRLLAALPAR